MDWNAFVDEINRLEGSRHSFMPGCPSDRLEWLEVQWGSLDTRLHSMLRCFNGAELFIEGVPMLTILGVSTTPPQPPLIWPQECCMDYWLQSLKYLNQAGWPIARTNYGSLWMFNSGAFYESNSTADQIGNGVSFDAWIRRVIEDGKDYISDSP